MGMPCTVNSILKLKLNEGYPETLNLGLSYQARKQGYRIIPIDVPVQLVDETWTAYAEVIIHKLTWEAQTTLMEFKLSKIYEFPLKLK
ncbi:DUF2584 domain-containing protein [Kovacikia minuta CCNUW1]|uniref:DUF2584 family protein n=1 Tax=Kovacikia minuta TaxID=2931930 RepID=UPI001CCCB698|nr:DUF2584 family protein [Kovacikia minuta]UBF27391.1 DUF2584 domain-containing protein [Kovacikia minuta CCNUW1]